MQAKPIRSFSRGLSLLASLNRHGSATALTLARETGLPRATIYRLLQTLLDDGYISRGVNDERFHLSLKVRNLSEGFEDEQWISGVAAPALAKLTKEIHWPSDVATLQGLKMVVRETTHRLAPLSIDRNMIGRELPLLASSTGLAYLAFVPRHECETILALLARSSDQADAPARSRKDCRRVLAATRRQGYALRQGGPIWQHTGAIALPIRQGSRVVGCVNVIWMARVVSSEEGLRRCLAPLRRTRDAIEKGLLQGRHLKSSAGILT